MPTGIGSLLNYASLHERKDWKLFFSSEETMMRTKAVLEQFIYIRVKILHSF
jgi:hypothetical protein